MTLTKSNRNSSPACMFSIHIHCRWQWRRGNESHGVTWNYCDISLARVLTLLSPSILEGNPFVDAFIHEENDSIHCLSLPARTEIWKQTTEWHQYSIWPHSCIFDELFLASSNKKSKAFNSHIRLHAGVVRALNRSTPRVPAMLFDADDISFDIQQRG